MEQADESEEGRDIMELKFHSRFSSLSNVEYLRW